MLKLKYSTINKAEFTMALAKVAAAPKLPVKTAYILGKIQTKVNQELQEGRKIFQSIVEKCAEKDAEGKVVHDEQGMFKIPADNQKEFDAQCESMMDIDFELPYHRVAMTALEPVGLSGKELMALEPILLCLEVIEGGGEQPKVEAPTVSA